VIGDQEARRLVAAHHHLLSQPNIVSLHVGEQTTAGERTGATALVVGVIEKGAPHTLSSLDSPVPRHVTFATAAGEVSLPTDVVEEGEVVALAGPPFPGGSVVQTEGLNRFGSLGVNIEWEGGYRLLSCAHVLTAFDAGLVGRPVAASNSPVDDFTRIATVNGQKPVTCYPSLDQPNPVYNTQDLAWADVRRTEASPDIIDIGTPIGIRAPVGGEAVRIYGGYTEDLAETSIESVAASTRVKSQYSDGSTVYSFWRDVQRLDASTLALLAGDSGSAVVADEDKAVVGVVFSAAMLSAYSCRV
jgi:hypothetical protein